MGGQDLRWRQRFEYTFELLWKTLKDFLENEGVGLEIISPKNVIKTAASVKLLEGMGADGEILLDMYEKRNLLAHTYNVSALTETLTRLKDSYLPEMGKVHAYLDARAKGTYKKYSDIDICLFGESGTDGCGAARVKSALDDLNVIYTFDTVWYDDIQTAALREHIDQAGVSIYGGA